MAQFNITNKLKDIMTLTLMIAGACDSLCGANYLDYTRLPNASLHVFSRASHYPHREEPAAWARVVLDFIDHGPTNAGKLFQSITATRKAVEAKRASKL
jgi:pimeloyl-ACP methyl ester carboxylesterase